MDPSLHPAWKQAVVDFQAAGFSYGDVVPLDWLYRAMKVEKPKPETPQRIACKLNLEFGDQFGKFRAELLEAHLVDIQKLGDTHNYVVVPPPEQVPRAHNEGMRQLRKTAKSTARRMKYVADDLLTDGDRARDADLVAHFSQLRDVIMRRPRLSMQKMIGRGERANG